VRDIAGLGQMIRMILRRDRIQLPVWIIVIGLLPAGIASTFIGLYPTDAALREAAATIASNSAFVAFLGPVQSPTLGGLVVWRVGAALSVLVGLMSVLLITRHTRAEEQTGRRELIGATTVGRQAPLVAALVVGAAANLVAGLFVVGGLLGNGLDAKGAVAFGLAITAVGWFFLGVAALAAQLPESSRTSNAIGMAVVGAAFVLRVAGDAGRASGAEWLSWISPIGLAARVGAFAGERWWPVAVLVVVAAGLVAASVVISSRRDVGSAVIPTRTGPAEARPALRSPWALAWRMQRGLALSWLIAFAVFGSLLGAFAKGIGTLMDETPSFADIIARLGGSSVVINAFLAAMLSVASGVAAAHGVQAVLRLRGEETDLHAEIVLAGAVDRRSWVGSHLLFGLVAPAVDLLVVGAAMGLSYGISTGDLTQVFRVAGSAMAYVPASWVMVGLALLLFGLVPRRSGLGWSVLGAALILTLLGGALNLDHRLLDLSPFTHSPNLPGGAIAALPIAVLTVLAASLAWSGLVAFSHRDLE
jgi:ABC-2 type transport system permease protein